MDTLALIFCVIGILLFMVFSIVMGLDALKKGFFFNSKKSLDELTNFSWDTKRKYAILSAVCLGFFSIGFYLAGEFRLCALALVGTIVMILITPFIKKVQAFDKSRE